MDRVVAEGVGDAALAAVPLALAHGSVTVVRLSYWAPESPPMDSWGAAHTRIVLSAEQALRGIYPSVDLIASSSSLADASLADAAREHLLRARDIEGWVAQSLMTAAGHTGVPGERFTPHEALTQLRAVLT